MPPRKAWRIWSAPDVEGNQSYELSYNNIETPILEVTTATIVDAIRDLKENQNEMIVTFKQLLENMIAIFKPTTSATVQRASATQDKHAPKPNNDSFLT